MALGYLFFRGSLAVGALAADEVAGSLVKTRAMKIKYSNL
jgi:hypothetical protein